LPAVATRFASLTGWRRAAIAVVAGAATALAQPPVSQPAVLFLALPALFWLVEGARGKRDAFAIGWLAGVGHFAAALFWIVEPFLIQPEVHGWMAPLALVGMAGGMALFWAVPFALARAWRPGLGRLLALAALWTLADYLRSHLLGGFPWGLVAYAWVDTPVMQVEALFGPHLLGLLTLVAALLPATGRPTAMAVAAALVAVGWGYGAWRLAQPLAARAPPYVVRLVQPDADQREKWLPGMEQVFFERHLALTTAPAAPTPDVTIWSETAVPFLLGRDRALLARSAAAAAPGRLILGIRRVEAGPDGDRWFNSLAVLEADGGTAAVYDKHHLVPFGEYIPLPGLLRRLGIPALTTLTESGFSAGSGPTIVAAPGVPPFLPLVCYEAIFPHGLHAPEGRPEWLVQVTNDAWFGTASGPYQHLAQARVRAIEQGLPLARAANTGISAMIDPYGRVVASLGLGETGYVDAALPPALSITGYARFGDTPALIVALVLLGLTLTPFFSGSFLKLDR
jgi:apolipoprotein N-acyltransferase